MTLISIHFSGNAKKVSVRAAGGKQVAEFSICRKNYSGKNATEESFTWINVSIYDPKPFVLEHLRDGVPVAGEGEAVLRSYPKKDGTKGTSLDVRCSDRGIDFPFSEGAAKAAPAQAPARPSTPAPGGGGEEEVPFMSLGEFE